MQVCAKRTPIERYIKGLTATSGMYSHILVRLKRRPGQKLSEATAYRNEIDRALENELKGQIKNVVPLDALTNFAWEVNNPFNSPSEMPAQIRQVLELSKVVDNFLPVVRTAPEVDPEACPSFDNIMNTLKQVVSNVDSSTYDVYTLRLLPGRHTCMPVRDLSTKLRDTIETEMLKSEKYYDRSFTAKQRLEEMQAKIDAEYEATQDPTLKDKKATLPTLPLQLDLYKHVGFWSTETNFGAGSPGAIAAQRQKEKREELPGGDFNAFAFNRHIGQRVVVCKIGEIFLKKGNRFRFMLQLQNNIQAKVGHIGLVMRCTHFFVIHPFNSTQLKDGNVTPFTDAQLKEIKEAILCIPGVENVGLSIQSAPTIEAVTRASQYLIANATATQLPTIDKPVSLTYSLIDQSEETKKIAESLFIPLSENASDEEKVLHEERKKIAALGLLETTKLGWKFDVHNHQPCPFPSRSAFIRDVNILNREVTATFNGMDSPVPTPGELIRLKMAEMQDQGTTSFSMDIPSSSSTQSTVSTISTNSTTSILSEGSEEQASMWVKPKSGVSIRVECNNEFSYIAYDMGPDINDAVGGQPTGTGAETQTVVALLSGGMDSPVAAFSLMTRGMRVVLVHFQNANLADEDTVKHKIVKLAEQLSRYQVSTYLHIVPFSAIQDAIIMEVPGPARMLVYRRFMMHVSARIAHKYNAKFLVVGDALGQVASQTASNLYASYLNAPMPILSPLVGSNKKDIMNTARKIGTYDISAMPYGDCCSYFLAKHPMTRIRPQILSQYEASVGVNVEGGSEALIAAAHNSSAILRWNKPQFGVEVMREIRPVESKYREIVDEMMQACPARPKADDEPELNDANADKFLRERAEAEAKMLAKESNLDTNADIEESKDMNDFDDLEETEKENVPQVESEAREISRSSVKKMRLDTKISPLTTKNLVNTSSSSSFGTSVPKSVNLPQYKSDVSSAYLDNAATTRMLPEALDAMLPYLAGNVFGNASSQHAMGSTPSAAVEEARRVILGSINAPMESTSSTGQDGAAQVGEKGRKSKDQLLVFTSGGTESNNIAVIGAVRAAVEQYLVELAKTSSTSDGNNNTTPLSLRIHLITSHLEHSAILEPMRALEQNGASIILSGSVTASSFTRPISLKVDLSYARNSTNGEVDATHIDYLLVQDSLANMAANTNSELPYTVLSFVSIMHANNEVGVVQPLSKIGGIVNKYREQTLSHGGSELAPIQTLFHTDACQSYGKLFLDVQESHLDLVSLNGHKVHGPKGVGALYVRPTVRVSALTFGGGHEGNIRSGTINVPSIVGMAAAAAHFHGITTSLLDTSLSHQVLSAPLKRSIPHGVTSALIPTTSSLRAARQIADLYRMFVDIFPRPFFHGPTISADAESVCVADGTPVERLPNILSIVLGKGEWIDSTAILKFLSARGVYVSTGSACASNSEPAPSHVLLAMKVRSDMANATVRISVGHLTSEDEIAYAKSVFSDLAVFIKQKLEKVGGR